MDEISIMGKALSLALKSCGHTRPNPPVGAVIVKRSRIIGTGRHIRCGLDHAEVAAIKNCKVPVDGSSIYVTLEPCSRRGRVGPCTDAIISAGIKKVVYLCPDPNKVNRNRARRILSGRGIEVECWASSADPAKRALARKAWDLLLKPFAKHIAVSRPFVTVKLAMSLDGKICDSKGVSRWISCRKALKETSRWRERFDAVMVGAQTLRKDNPSLLCHTKENDDLYRVVISKSGFLPENSQVFTDAAKERTLVYKSPEEALEDLGRRGFLSVLCEGGLSLARSLAARALVDEWVTILCPIVIGDGNLSDSVRYESMDPAVFGSDVMVRSSSSFSKCPF